MKNEKDKKLSTYLDKPPNFSLPKAERENLVGITPKA
jgi:hypothetical protein